MAHHQNFFRKRLFLHPLILILLAGCNPWAASQVPNTGPIFPIVSPFYTATYYPTVTPIADRPTRTPRGFLILPAGTIVPAPSSAPQPGAEGSSPDASVPAAPSTGRITGRPLGLIPARNGLWAMYPNGTRVTLLTSDPILYLSVSPTGWAAAYITSSDPEIFSQEKPFGYTLKFITLYDQRTYTITSLDPPGLSSASPPEVLDSAFQAVQAFHHDALAWSPNGQLLAFTSLHETSSEQPASSNIYIYSIGSSTLRRLTTLQLPQGPGHPYGLAWAPFSGSLYYAVAYNFGAGVGYGMAGAWVDRLDGTSIQVAEGEKTGDERVLAWQTAGTFLLSSWNSDCGDQNLRKIHLHNDMRGMDLTPLWTGCYASAQYNPLRDEILLSVTAQPGIPAQPQPGLYRISVSTNQASALASQSFERLYTNPSRAGGSSPAWFGYNRGEGLYSIQRNGAVQPLFTGPPYDGSGEPVIQPLFPVSGPDWLWSGNGLFLGRPGQPPQPIIDVPVSSLSASPAANGLYFFLAPAPDSTQLFAVRAGDWQPYIVDARILDPQRVFWTGP